MYDRKCLGCGETLIDSYEPLAENAPIPCECGGEMVRTWLPGKANAVIDDSIPGGLYIKHGLCHEDGTPRRFDSHTDIKKEAARKGYHNHVEHQGSKGSDRSKHTSRWI